MSEPSVRGITLCLSGGGFRATLFELGAIIALWERQVLPQIKSVYSVSGGSILGAFLYQNWDVLSNVDNNVDLVVPVLDRVIDFSRQNVFSRVLYSNLFGLPGIFRSRTAHLVANLRELYGEKKSLPDQPRGRKSSKFYCVASDLNTFDQLAFELGDGEIYRIRREDDPHRQSGERVSARLCGRDNRLQLAELVAYSASFPLAFEPQPYVVEESTTKAHCLLADGGVVENLGMMAALAVEANSAGGVPPQLLVVDAAQKFRPLDGQSDTAPLTLSPLKTVDYLMKLAANSRLALCRLEKATNIVPIRLADAIESAHSTALAQRHRLDSNDIGNAVKAATTLNSFQRAVARNLVTIGYYFCDLAIGAGGAPASGRLLDRVLALDSIRKRKHELRTRMTRSVSVMDSIFESVLVAPGRKIYLSVLLAIVAVLVAGFLSR